MINITTYDVENTDAIAAWYKRHSGQKHLMRGKPRQEICASCHESLIVVDEEQDDAQR